MEAETALSLMQRALAILDQTGGSGTTTACYLQTAIEAAEGSDARRPGSRPGKLQRPTDGPEG